MFSLRISTFLLGSVLAAFCLLSNPVKAANLEQLIDGVPLPADASPLSVDVSPFAGTWIGTWDGVLKTILVVESISADGMAKVIYAVAESPGRFKRAWFRYDAQISGNSLKIAGQRLVIHLNISKTGRLRAVLGDGFGFAVFIRRDLKELLNSTQPIPWVLGDRELLVTELVEQGQPIRLETVVFRPSGSGPFPLAVVNHGSTGSGADPQIARLTWTNPWLADVLNENGWIVAFPQRRGRGNSDGLYDEGFSADRRKGYTCDTKRSLAGAERALVDIRAAIGSLKDRQDVNNQPTLLVGNSRGGILSVAYAGRHPADIHGVINFVGGWISENCTNAETINQSLFKDGSTFPKPMLWIYGKDDIYYSMPHSRKNFDVFESNGGSGDFVEVTVAGQNNGHSALVIPPLWSETVKRYLDHLPNLVD